MEYRKPKREESLRTLDQLNADRLEATISGFVRRLKRSFGSELTQDPKGFKLRVLEVLRCELPTKRGRPSDPRLDEAARMVEQGTPTREVLRWLVPGFDNVDEYGRYLAAKGLRAALARRRKQGRPARN
jgi:hypothetical protein